jgi:hypothetical protein
MPNERKEPFVVTPTWRYILRRVIFVFSLSVAAQFGFTAAHASTDSARPMIDEIFESTFANGKAEPEAQEPAAASPSPTSGTAGQSLVVPAVPELKLPKPAAVEVSVKKPEPVEVSLKKPEAAEVSLKKPEPIEATLESVATAGQAGEGSPGESSPGEDDQEPEEAEEEPRAERSTAEERANARRVSSTAYCLTGTMASGRRVYPGAAAMNGTPLGSRYEVLDGPRAGETFVVEDRIGHGSAFDIAYPGDCRGAYSYGRRTISIRPV